MMGSAQISVFYVYQLNLTFFLIFCLAIPLGYMCLWIDPPVKRTNNKNLCFPTFTEQKLYLLQNSVQFGSKQHSLAAGRVTDEKFDREISVAVTLAMERTFIVNILYLIRYIQIILIRTFIVNILHLIIGIESDQI